MRRGNRDRRGIAQHQRVAVGGACGSPRPRRYLDGRFNAGRAERVRGSSGQTCGKSRPTEKRCRNDTNKYIYYQMTNLFRANFGGLNLNDLRIEVMAIYELIVMSGYLLLL